MLEHLETGDPLFSEMLGKQMMIGAIGAILWYILQKRELQRFFQQQEAAAGERKAVKKETQVTNVLDSQSDAIIIVSADVRPHALGDPENQN